jgi:hypothetical protein
LANLDEGYKVKSTFNRQKYIIKNTRQLDLTLNAKCSPKQQFLIMTLDFGEFANKIEIEYWKLVSGTIPHFASFFGHS